MSFQKRKLLQTGSSPPTLDEGKTVGPFSEQTTQNGTVVFALKRFKHILLSWPVMFVRQHQHLPKIMVYILDRAIGWTTPTLANTGVRFEENFDLTQKGTHRKIKTESTIHFFL